MKPKLSLLILLYSTNLLGQPQLVQQLSQLQGSLQRLHEQLLSQSSIKPLQPSKATQDFSKLPPEIVEQIIFQTFPEKIVFKSELLEAINNLEDLALTNKRMATFINDDFKALAKKLKAKIVNPKILANFFIGQKLSALANRFIKGYLAPKKKSVINIPKFLYLNEDKINPINAEDLYKIFKGNNPNEILIQTKSGIGTPLMIALKKNFFRLAYELLTIKKADPNEPSASLLPLYQALYIAVLSHSDLYEIVDDLINSGADSTLPADGDHTLLTKLIKEVPYTVTYDAIEKLLLKLKSLKIDFNQPDGFNNLPLYLAYSLPKYNFQQPLLKFADINAQDRNGRTTLMKLVLDDKFHQGARAFLGENSDITIRDNDGKTAEQLARQKGYANIADMIKRHKPFSK